MAGRTLMQQALPITFGLKAARWLATVARQVERLRELRSRVLVVQLGGAAGTLASLGDEGAAVVAGLAEELGLGEPELPWHAERDRVAELAAWLGVVAATMAKIAGDLVLLAQGEVGEAAEGAAPGKGGSSTLPQKRNPVDATLAVAAARLALGLVPVVLNGTAEQEHERAAGAWQAEWSSVPDLFCRTASAVAHVRAGFDGLEVDADAMARNLALSDGLIMAESLTMALAAKVGRHEAQRIVKQLAKSGANLERAALADPTVTASLKPEQVRAALNPANYLGSAGLFVDRALAAFARICRSERSEESRP
jgi:3-carboxy-cis,cis-muconate cycloisomerase